MIFHIMFQQIILLSHYLEIMDEILPVTPNDRLFYGAKHGYDEIVKSALQQPSGRPQAGSQDEPSRADIHAFNDVRASLDSNERIH